MLLLDVSGYCLKEYHEPYVPKYAILSHRWEHEEILYSDITNGQYKHKHGFKKLAYVCNQAKQDGLRFVWVDSCCIDKGSSAELSEAVNSMFRYYEASEFCYAYLSDLKDLNANDGAALESVWFKRGWTLQELIAPLEVYFYGSDWSFLGSRSDLSKTLSTTTKIPQSLLKRRSRSQRALETFSVAQRMSWAAARETTRIEDRAYSLMGLFSVNMSLLYGEGENAFIRLQEEILKTTDDLSILAWDGYGGLSYSENYLATFGSVLGSLLAPSPDCFAECGDVYRSIALNKASGSAERTLTMTNVGLHLVKPQILDDWDEFGNHKLAVSLECGTLTRPWSVICLQIVPVDKIDQQNNVCMIGWNSIPPLDSDRVISAPLTSPSYSSKWASLVIKRRAQRFQKVQHHIYQGPTHLLVDYPQSADLEILHHHPVDCWHEDRRVFDLEKGKLVLGSVGTATVKLRCGVLVLHHRSTSAQIAILFARIWSDIDSNLATTARNIVFRVCSFDRSFLVNPQDALRAAEQVQESTYVHRGFRYRVLLMEELRGNSLIAILQLKVLKI